MKRSWFSDWDYSDDDEMRFTKTQSWGEDEQDLDESEMKIENEIFDICERLSDVQTVTEVEISWGMLIMWIRESGSETVVSLFLIRISSPSFVVTL